MHLHGFRTSDEVVEFGLVLQLRGDVCLARDLIYIGVSLFGYAIYSAGFSVVLLTLNSGKKFACYA